MTNSPTIANLQWLNRESLALFPLAMLDALMDAGVDLNVNADAIVKWTVFECPHLVMTAYRVVKGSKEIAILLPFIEPSGVVGYRPGRRTRCETCRHSRLKEHRRSDEQKEPQKADF